MKQWVLDLVTMSALVVLPVSLSAASITWSAPAIISGDADVCTNGAKFIASCLGCELRQT